MARILLIDDDDDLSHFLQDRLAEHGHQVESLDRAEPAPELLAAAHFDLVLLDNKMPGMTGIEFLAALQGRGLDTPVILMTGHTTTDTAIQAMNLGAFDYVIKPGDYDGLFHELRGPIDEALKITRPAPEVRVQVDAAASLPPGPALLGKSRPMLEVYKLIGRFAKSDAAVLVQGETGTGKELVAQALHANSPRKNKPFVALNCTAFNENLVESELFGHVPQAFTGATKLRKGCFEYASGGTLFLDEIGDLPAKIQVKLLRVLENQELTRVGGNEVVKVNVRLVTATHRNLHAAVEGGTFRQDLYFRINRLSIALPPLREREADLELLADYFLARAARDAGERTPMLHAAALDRLRSYSWPGNVRELQNLMCRAVGMCRGPQVMPAHLDFGTAGPEAAVNSDDENAAVEHLRQLIRWAWQHGDGKLYPLLHDLLERELLRFALTELGGNQTEAAERLGMARGTVIKRTKEYGLK